MLTPTTIESHATATVNGIAVGSGIASDAIPLGVGSNTINILTTAQDGTRMATYTITVTRQGSAEDTNNDGYNENDFNKLQAFLNQPSADTGKTNGEQINPYPLSYNPSDPKK